MSRSPTALSETARKTVAEALNASLADGLDLYGATKQAHWNIKGPHFVALHGQLDELADALREQNDEMAERIATLGHRARGTARMVAKASRLEDLPADIVRDIELVRHVSQRLEVHLGGLRAARKIADEQGDLGSSDLLVGAVTELEKHGWMLLSTIEG